MTREERKKAIDALKISTPIMAMTQEEFNDYIQTLNKVMDWLEQDTVSRESYDHEYFLRKEFEIKIAKLEQQELKWISVRERLPEVGIDVLICDEEGTIYLSHKSSFGSFIDEWGSKVKDIRAWMPLPEPYKAESEE